MSKTVDLKIWKSASHESGSKDRLQGTHAIVTFTLSNSDSCNRSRKRARTRVMSYDMTAGNIIILETIRAQIQVML